MPLRTFGRLFSACALIAFTTCFATAQSSIPTPLLFSGNTTVVAPPIDNTFYAGGHSQFAGLVRASDCSMYAILAEIGFQPPFSAQLIQADYQDNLHQLAGLTTTPDQFPHGCPNPQQLGDSYYGYAYAGMIGGNHILAVLDNGNQNMIDIYNGMFSPMTQHVAMVQQFTAAVAAPGPMVAADLNGDSNLDLVIATAGNQTDQPGGVEVHLANGDGTFHTTPDYTFTAPANTSVSVFGMGDVNGDGKPDIVALLSTSGSGGNTLSLQVLFGQGNGTFTTGPVTAVASGFAINMLVADINGDGKADVIVNDGEVFLGNGDGTFRAGTPVNFPSFGVESVAAADFNNDSKTDLVAIINTQVYVYLGNGDGTFQTPATSYSSVFSPLYVTTTDVDGDGNTDIVVAVTGGGSFLPNINTIFGTGGLHVLMGNGDGTFRGAITYPTGATGYAIADVNGDGKPDIISAGGLLTGDGHGGFTIHSGAQFPGLDPANAESELRLADLNGDHVLDAVLTTGQPFMPGPLFVALGQAGGTFATGTSLSLPAVLDVQIADVNGDGKPDLLAVNNPSGNGTGIQLNLLLGNGDGTFAAPQTITLPAGTAQSAGAFVYPADFNKDGKLDLLVVDQGAYYNHIPGGVYLLLGNGDGTFQAATTIGSIVNPYAAAVADVNKDGKLDLIISNTNFPTGNHPARRHSANNTFNPVVLLGNGDGTFSSAGTISTSAIGPLPLVVADFNGDGNPDVAMAECCGLALLHIAFGIGDGTFQESQAMQVSTSPADVQVADLNGDGLPDIVTGTDVGTKGVTVLINQYSMASGGGTPDFALAANPTTLTASGSASTTTTISVTPANGFTGTVSFSCSGLPANTTCGFSPATVTPSGGAASTTLTITTGVQSAMLHRPGGHRGELLMASAAGSHQKPQQRSWRMLFGFGFGGMFLLIVLGAGAKARGVAHTKHLTRYLLCGLMLTMALFWIECGSGNNSSGTSTGSTGSGNNTPSGTYMITVTATSGSLQHSTVVTLTVQ